VDEVAGRAPSNPILGTFACCCASAGREAGRAKLTSKTTMVFIAIRPCLLRFVVDCPEPFYLLFIKLA
jgi:hypothetical protein